MNINSVPQPQAIDTAARAAGAAAAGAAAGAVGAAAAGIARGAAAAAAAARDSGPELGQTGSVIPAVGLVDDPQSATELIDSAMSELTHIGPGPFADPATPPKTFAERESAMHQQLTSKLNEKNPDPGCKQPVYKFSNADLEREIARLKKEVKNIHQQREMGMTDCWGTMTNRQIACQSAIRAIETCLKERG